MEIITTKELIENPTRYNGQEVMLKDTRLIPGSVIKYTDSLQDGFQRPSFYCLLELDEESGLVLPFGVSNRYVQEVRPSTYQALLKASEGRKVSSRGKFQNLVIDCQNLGDVIAEVPEFVDAVHNLGVRLPEGLEKIAKNIDGNVRGKLADLDEINLHNHYYMEGDIYMQGIIIPALQLLSPKKYYH